MNRLHRGMLLACLCFSLLSTGCFHSKKIFDGVFTPNCKKFGVGSVCFENPTGKTVNVELKNHKIEVLAFSTLCFDLYEGNYEYKVKEPKRKWQDEVYITKCKEKKVELKECESC